MPYQYAETPSGLINSVNTVYTILFAPSPANSLELYLNGLLQKQTSDYTLVGNVITFIVAPTTGDTLLAYYGNFGSASTVNPNRLTNKTLADAIARAQNEFKGITLSTVDAVDFGNQIYNIIGSATNWQYLIVHGTPFGTVKDQMDYPNVPGDLMRLREAWIWDDSSTFTPVLPLRVFEYMQPTHIRSIPRAISTVDNTFFRLYPIPVVSRPGGDLNPGTYTGGPMATGGSAQAGQWLVLYDYYKRQKQLSVPTDNFEFDDAFFPTFFAGFIARVAEFLDDERAGLWGGRNEKGQFQGTGFWGTFAALLNEEVRF